MLDVHVVWKRKKKRLTLISMIRNIVDQPDTDFTVKSSLEYKICRNTYHLFYVAGEDAFVRRTLPSATANNYTVSRNKAWKSWLDKDKDTAELDDRTRSLYT